MADVVEILLRLGGEGQGAEDAVRGLKDRLAELSDRSVRINLDDTAAATKIRELDAELKRLRDEHIGVKVDDAGADAKIAELEAKLATLRDKTVEVKVKTDNGSSLDILKNKMVLMGGAAAIVGPQILGALGQAALGAGALGVAAAGAGAAFGILGAGAQAAMGAQAAATKATAAQKTAQTQLTTALKSGNQSQILLARQNLATAVASASSAQKTAAAWQKSTSQVRTAVGDMQDAFLQALGPGIRGLFSGLVSAMHSVTSALPSMSGGFKALGDGIKHALSSPSTRAGIRSLVKGMGDIARLAAPLAGPLVHAFLALGKIFENIAKAAMPALVGLTKELAAWLTKVAGSTGTGRFREHIHQWIGEFADVIKAVGMLAKALLPLFSSAAGFLPLVTVLASLISEFTHLLASLGPVGRLLAGGLGVLVLVTRFKSLEAAMKLVTGSGKFLMAAFAALRAGSLAPLIALFPTLAAKLGLVAAAEGATAATSDVAATGLVAVDVAATPLIATLGALALAALPWIAAIAAIVAAIVVVIKFHKQLWAAAKAVWHAIESVVKGAVHGISVAITAAWNWIKTATVAVWHFIEGIVSGAWKKITGLVTSAAHKVASVVTGAWKAIKGATSAVWHAIEGIVTGAWHAIEHAVSEGVSNVVKFVASLPGKALAALGHIGSALLDAGKNLVLGFIHGIESMFSAVANVAGNLISQVGGAITGLLGIGSPSKVAHEWGQAVGQGMANGIRSQHRKVAAAAKGLAQSAAAGMSGARLAPLQLGLAASFAGVAAGTAGAAAAGSRVQVTVNSHSLVPGSPEQMRQIAGAVTESIRRSSPSTVK